jgi:hypothetical protein
VPVQNIPSYDARRAVPVLNVSFHSRQGSHGEPVQDFPSRTEGSACPVGTIQPQSEGDRDLLREAASPHSGV